MRNKFLVLFVLIVSIFGLCSASANAVDYLWINRTSKTGVMMKTPTVSVTQLTLTSLIANVTTSSATITTGNFNIPVTVNGVLLYIKAHTAQ